MNGRRLWSAITAVSTVFMAATDALTWVPRWRIETWVLLLFLQMVASVFLLDNVRTRRQKLRAVSWLAGIYLGLYNATWVVLEVVQGHIYSNIGLYPFGLNISWVVFFSLIALGFALMHEGGKR